MTIEVLLNNPHEQQRFVLENRKRFTVLKCGRRWGKTELFQELLSESIERQHITAYYTPTYKDLHEVWLETLRVFHPIVIQKSETVKQINFLGGAKLDMWSMEDPDSGRGRKYHRVIVDEAEKSKKFKQAWEETIRPTLTDYKGDAYLISTPKFGQTYFKEIAKNELTFDDWKTFKFSTFGNPYIDPQEIEAARKLLEKSPGVFECEYLADDVDSRSINAFAYALNTDVHFDTSIMPDFSKIIHLSIDFNLEPFSCLVANIYRDYSGLHVHFVGEISIAIGSVPEMGERLRNQFRNNLHNLLMTGDSLGKNRNISQRDNASNFEMIRRMMGLRQSQMMIPVDPSHETSRNDCNYLLHMACDPANKVFVKINPDLCPTLAAELRTTQCDEQGQIIKADRSQLSQRADFLDNFRYTVNTFLKTEIERHQKQNFGKLRLHS